VLYDVRVTVYERLVASGAVAEEAERAAVAIANVLRMERAVVLTDDVLDAARRGDLALLEHLLLEDVAPEPDELEALAEAASASDGTRYSLAEMLAKHAQ
jgi:hypothetical protein